MSEFKDKKYSSNLLKTHTQFDCSGYGMSHPNINPTDLVTNLRSAVPSSLLALALIHKLCKDLESDEVKRNNLFKTVCHKFSEEKYLDQNAVLLLDVIMHNPEYGDKISFFIREIQRSLSKPTPQNNIVASVPMSNYQTSNIAEDNLYAKAFVEIERIATGGFGTVVKAKHKMDGVTYAVKKISFRAKNIRDFQKVRLEPQALATLKHPNIVNYNYSWLETSYDENDDPSVFEESVESVSSVLQTIEIVEESFSKSSAEFPPSPNRRRHSSGATCSSQDDYSKDGNDLPTVRVIEAKTENNELVLRKRCINTDIRATLFIQMEYCDCDLRHILDHRNTKEGEALLKSLDPLHIFYQVLNGVYHIHSAHIIHRDIKPGNIFVSKSNGTVKIGDFGLSCLMHHVTDNEPCLHCLTSSGIPSAVVGTPPYAAPEQKAGLDYDFKVDIYSLGIILFELLHPYETRTEFSQNLEKATYMDQFPKSFNSEQVDLIKRLIMKEPALRPTAADVLKHRLFKKKSLKKKIQDIKKKISNLDQAVKTLEDSIVKLMQEQSKMSAQLAKLTVDKEAEVTLLKEQLGLFQSRYDIDD